MPPLCSMIHIHNFTPVISILVTVRNSVTFVNYELQNNCYVIYIELQSTKHVNNIFDTRTSFRLPFQYAIPYCRVYKS